MSLSLLFGFSTYLRSNSLLEVVHEALSSDSNHDVLVFVNPSTGKEFPMVVNTYTVDGYFLQSKINQNEKYDLSNFNSVLKLLCRYNLQVNNIDTLLINAINLLCRKKSTCSDSENSSSSESSCCSSDPETRMNQTLPFSHNEIESCVKTMKRKKSRKHSHRKSNERGLINIPPEREPQEKKIDYLEFKKNYEKEQNEQEEEKKQVVKTEAELKEEEEFRLKRQQERDKKREEETRNRFLSEKDFTYKKLYESFFVKNQIKDWDNIPELFKCKFPIYLYMDGKGIDGKDRHKRLLDQEDEFTVFKYLYETLTDDNFEMPEDEKYVNIINDFVETLPPIDFMTEDNIMKLLNNPDDPLFEVDGTSQRSGDNDSDTGGNETYGHVPDKR